VELELIRRALHELCEAGLLDDLRVVLGRLFLGLGIGQYAFVRVDSTVLGTAPSTRLESSRLLAAAVSHAWLPVHRSVSAPCAVLCTSLSLAGRECTGFVLLA